MKKVWVSDYKRTASAVFADRPSDERSKQLNIIEQLMSGAYSLFYKVEREDGVLMGYFIVAGDNYRFYIRPIFSSDEIVSDFTKLISAVMMEQSNNGLKNINFNNKS